MVGPQRPALQTAEQAAQATARVEPLRPGPAEVVEAGSVMTMATARTEAVEVMAEEEAAPGAEAAPAAGAVMAAWVALAVAVAPQVAAAAQAPKAPGVRA